MSPAAGLVFVVSNERYPYNPEDSGHVTTYDYV